MKNAPTFRRLLRYLIPYRRPLFFAFICLVCASIGQLIFPWLIKGLFDTASTGQGHTALTESHSIIPSPLIRLFHLETGHINSFQSLRNVVIAIAFLFAFTSAFQFLQNCFLVFIGQNVITDLRVALFRHLQKLSAGFYTRNHTGDLISRMTNDTSAVQTVLTVNVIELIRQPAMAIGGTIFLFRLDTTLALLCLSVGVPILLVAKLFGLRIRRNSFRVQASLGELTTLLNESLSGISILRSFTLEKYMATRFETESRRVIDETMGVVRWRSGSDALISFLSSMAAAAVLGYGGNLMLHGRMSTGDLVAFILYMEMVTTPITSIAGIYSGFQQSLAAAQRLFEILDEKPEIADVLNPLELPDIKGHVQFENITLSYDPGQPVLRGINLDVKPGQILALVGPSGAGKTSIVSLISRLYDPTEGRVLIDGHDIRGVRLDTLRHQIGVVPQETFLFGVSIRENIRYGRLEATDEEVEEAAKAANAHHFIQSLSQGYDTLAGERGVRLSGGERQRIAIARALLKDPRILILDEATSALDTQSELLVQEALYRLMQGRTSFVIAHRLSTIRQADAIAVLDKGRLVEYGTHTDLLEREGLYAHLYELQFKWEQLGVFG